MVKAIIETRIYQLLEFLHIKRRPCICVCQLCMEDEEKGFWETMKEAGDAS